jgi:hypothetical protein
LIPTSKREASFGTFSRSAPSVSRSLKPAFRLELPSSPVTGRGGEGNVAGGSGIVHRYVLHGAEKTEWSSEPPVGV